MKALITDHVHPILLEKFDKAGISSTYLPKINQKEVESMIKDFEILVINSKITIEKNFLNKATRLKVIGRLGSGLEIIDLKAAEKNGVLVFNSPEGNRDAVAEHAVGMLLALFNNLNRAHRDVVHFNWDREANRGEELMGKTVGIIGFGNTGQALAKKISGFGVETLFYDKYATMDNNHFARGVGLDELQEKADIISFHVPYNKETHHYLNDSFVDKMKKDFYLINTSRGKVVCKDALLKALGSSKIKGACLDVFDNEKIQSYSVEEKAYINAFNQSGCVIFSTHVAGWTRQSKIRLAEILSHKILATLP